MPLNQAQRQAVEYLDGPLLVLAGPGTGKTQLLSEKVAYILQNTDANPENILCLTFTESGAHNMRERLASTVGKAAAKVNINTYHAFGTQILDQYKNYAELAPYLTQAIDEVSQYKIIRTIQQSLNGTDILRGDSVSDIIDTISAAKSYQLTPADLTKIAEQNIQDSEVLSNSISPLLKNIIPRVFEPNLTNVYEPIYALLQPYINLPPIIKNIERSIASLARDLATALDEARANQSVAPLTAWRNNYFEKDADDNYRLKDRVANKKLLSLANVMSCYDAELAKDGLYDFDDMIEKAITALQTNQGFRLTLSEKYQYILLDEFQDTNPSQLAIVKLLTDYEKPLIMAVGDDDQAIYAFQGASATNLTDFQKHYDAKVIKLTENYRSTQEILDLSAKIIADAPNRYDVKNLHANRPEPATSQITRHEFISADAEYFWVANEIAQLINNGVAQTDIAVIAPKHKYLLPLLPFLKNHDNINIAYEKRENILDDPQIHAILTIAKYLHDIASERTPSVSLLEALSYDFWDVSMATVLKALDNVAPNTALADLTGTTDNQLQRVATFLTDLVAKALTEPFTSFVNFLIGRADLNGYHSNFVDTYLQTPYTIFAFYENLNTLVATAEKHLNSDNLKLADIIATVQDYEMATTPILCASPYRESENAIQLLSAHKAKGLEFPYVFLIALDNAAWGKAKGNNNLLVLPKNLVQIRHTGTTDGERLRLLYVAMTRAKEHLIMTNSIKDFRDKSPERLEYFAEYEDEHKTPISPYLLNKEIICHYHDTPNTPLTNLALSWTTTLKNSPDMRALYTERLANYRISASDLTSFIDIVYAGPTEFFRRRVLKDVLFEQTEATAYGTLIHRTFEKITREHCDNKVALDFFLTEINNLAGDDMIKTHLRERGPHDLQIALQKFNDILRSNTARAEVNMSTERLAYDNIPLVGIIDHLEIDETNKTIKIYDFKTGKYHSKDWDSDPTLLKYKLQLEFYKLLLNLSPQYAKYNITEGHILFVTPDKDDQVYDKTYHFSATSDNAFKALLAAVYRAIKTIDFLDDAEIYLEPDRERTVANIKEFIGLMIAKYGQKL